MELEDCVEIRHQETWEHVGHPLFYILYPTLNVLASEAELITVILMQPNATFD